MLNKDTINNNRHSVSQDLNEEEKREEEPVDRVQEEMSAFASKNGKKEELKMQQSQIEAVIADFEIKSVGDNREQLK